MKRIRIKRSRGESRPVSFEGPHGPWRYVALDDNTRTVLSRPLEGNAELEYGPGTPGPFGDILGRIGDTKVVISYAKWGLYTRGRHAFEIEFGDEHYVLVSRGDRRYAPQLELPDGTLVATFSRKGGTISESASLNESVLVALIGGSGIADLTLPQHWSPRH